jgi:hypothetical protein
VLRQATALPSVSGSQGVLQQINVSIMPMTAMMFFAAAKNERHLRCIFPPAVNCIS